MPFNKGDFTQQGVNGHVNATVRLNEKRLVNIDLTSNEEAEGCTIAGTVTDLLNDKVYNIGSAPSGNIEITENTAEPLNIAQYATATVNVAGGGGDAPFCELLITNDEGSDRTVTGFDPETYQVKRITIPDGESASLLFPYVAGVSGYVGTWVNYTMAVGPENIIASSLNSDFTNLNNVELFNDNDIYLLKVINASLPSSVSVSSEIFPK